MYTHPWDGTTNAQWDDVVLFIYITNNLKERTK